MAESTILADRISVKLDKSCRLSKMKQIKNLQPKTTQALIKEYFNVKTVPQTDKSTAFSDLSKCVDVYFLKMSNSEESKFNGKGDHIASSNL